tara:strand:- start:6004 stop:6912 length:909 start_codon:yes stop_codon:yes gene_type:complete
MSFASLKKQSKLGSYTQKLIKEVEKMNTSGGGGADERFWKPEMDKTGVGSAVIRFLPAPDGEEFPWVKMYSHAFKGPGGWYIENSLTTNGGKDPVSEYNRELWNSGNEKDKDTVRKQKRKLSYFSNIYVVRDPANPANEGKVFLYKFGKKIFDKVLNAMQPEFEDETPINPFDFWQGANFRLKIKKVDGYWNYDKSEFDSPSPLLEDDDALEALWKKQYSLAALVANDQFKSYEDLQKRLKSVLNTNISSRPVDEEVSDEDDSRGSFKPDFNARKEPVAAAPTSSTEEEDDALSYFQRLAQE